MEKFDKERENVEYFYRHFNDNNTTKRGKIVGTVCMAVNKDTSEIVAAGAVAGHGDQFSKKIGRQVARGRANKFLAGQKVDVQDTGLVKQIGMLTESQDPTERLFQVELGREDGYIAVVETAE